MSDLSRLYFELVRDLAATANADGYFVDLNSRWAEVTGFTLDQLRERPFLEFVHPDDRARADREAQKLRDGGTTVSFLVRMATASGGWRWLDWSARGLPDGTLVGSGRDVTDHVVAEQYVETLLRRLQGMVDEERERLAGELHDFSLQPLIAALMHVEVAADAADGRGGELPESLDRIEALLRDAITSTRDIMAGLRPLLVESMSIDELVAQVAERVSEDFSVLVQVQPPLGTGALCAGAVELTGEAKMLAYRLLREATINAARHAGADCIDVRAEVDSRAHALCLHVEDHGQGFEEPVSCTARPLERFGLGLGLLLEQVALLGGEYLVESRPGEGTAVRVSLPLATA